MIDEFITPHKLSQLTECAAVTCGMVQAIKGFIPLDPVLICFLSAIFVSFSKLILANKWNKQEIILAILNIFPIYLTASGAYDTLKALFK